MEGKVDEAGHALVPTQWGLSSCLKGKPIEDLIPGKANVVEKGALVLIVGGGAAAPAPGSPTCLPDQMVCGGGWS